MCGAAGFPSAYLIGSACTHGLCQGAAHQHAAIKFYTYMRPVPPFLRIIPQLKVLQHSERCHYTSRYGPQHGQLPEGNMTCACVCARVRCSFNGRLGILERHGGNQNLPDMYAIMQGMALWLQSQDSNHFEVSTPICPLYASWSAAGIMKCCVTYRV